MQITSKKTIISGGIGVDYIKFNLSDVWAELDVNIFMSNGVSDAYRFNYTGEHIAIPAELISEPGILDIGIVGYKDNARVTVAKLVTPFTVVMQSVNGEKEPPQPVEDIYADITGALNDTKELQDKVDKALTVLDDLVHFVYGGTGCRLLLIGDSAQLPPVGEEDSPALSSDFMEKFLSFFNCNICKQAFW